MWSRRAVLAGGISALATAAVGAGPSSSMRPRARPSIEHEPVSDLRPRARPDTRSLIEEARIGGTVGFVIADAETGEVLETIDGGVALPPASVAKAVTALYALEGLGAGYQFKTRLIAEGAILNGILDGNLILAGGGNPNFLTDDLADLAQMLKEAGIRSVTGDFKVWGGALREVAEIDATQLDHLGYNPSVSGLNLNFNRVHFEWKRSGEDYAVTMDARSEKYRADVTVARMQIVERRTPIYAYADLGDVDAWTVARGALGREGSRWLPVREPALYAGDVFRTFARSHGIVLKAAQQIDEMPDGAVVATHLSPPLPSVMRDMLKFSTNLTAEAAGMTATLRRTGQQRGLRTSALGMSRWCKQRAGTNPTFVDHSGLGDQSRISALDMVNLLTQDGVRGTLYPVLKNIRMVDASRKAIPNFEGDVRAKTGTLNFVSSLAGYLRTAGGRDLAFAFFATNLEAREVGKRSADEQPAGAATYNNRAKRLQQQLLQRWAKLGDG